MLDKSRVIFFDFDGVILESADIKTEAFVELFQEHQHQLSAIKEYHLSNMGVSRFVKFEWIYKNLLKQSLSEQESKQLGERFSKIVYEKILIAPFVPGAQELLQHVSKNSICFVASGTPEDELQSIVKERNLSGYFKEVCGTPRTKTKIVEEMIEKHNLKREHCWFIGDANTDYEAARTTGLKFIARNTPVMASYWKQLSDIWLVDSLIEVRDRWAAQ